MDTGPQVFDRASPTPRRWSGRNPARHKVARAAVEPRRRRGMVRMAAPYRGKPHAHVDEWRQVYSAASSFPRASAISAMLESTLRGASAAPTNGNRARPDFG